jgi:hypothetical protein
MIYNTASRLQALFLPFTATMLSSKVFKKREKISKREGKYSKRERKSSKRTKYLNIFCLQNNRKTEIPLTQH